MYERASVRLRAWITVLEACTRTSRNVKTFRDFVQRRTCPLDSPNRSTLLPSRAPPLPTLLNISLFFSFLLIHPTYHREPTRDQTTPLVFDSNPRSYSFKNHVLRAHTWTPILFIYASFDSTTSGCAYKYNNLSV